MRKEALLKGLCSMLRIEPKALMMITFHAERDGKLKHVQNWLNLFEGFHNKELQIIK